MILTQNIMDFWPEPLFLEHSFQLRTYPNLINIIKHYSNNLSREMLQPRQSYYFAELRKKIRTMKTKYLLFSIVIKRAVNSECKVSSFSFINQGAEQENLFLSSNIWKNIYYYEFRAMWDVMEVWKRLLAVCSIYYPLWLAMSKGCLSLVLRCGHLTSSQWDVNGSEQPPGCS